MPLTIRGKQDAQCKRILASLAGYETAHPSAEVEVYRQNSASIRVRIIDPDFAETSLSERHDIIWTYLDQLSDEDLSNLSILLLLTPEEAKESFANFNFEHPIRSRL